MEKGSTSETILAKQRLRGTKQRKAILSVLGGSETPMTAESIFLALRDTGVPVCLSTVYRTLDTLNAKGVLNKNAPLTGDRATYEIHTASHRHRLTCLRCSRSVAIHDCPLSELEKRLTAETQFSIRGHRLELFGYCPDCQEAMR